MPNPITPRHPIQPLVFDGQGVLRFKKNAIVEYLLDSGEIDMNHLAMRPFSDEDREQFAQLIGYSLSGFSELSYVSDETYDTSQKMHETGETEDSARIRHLEMTLNKARKATKELVPALFRVHPDDLDEPDVNPSNWKS